MFFLSFSRVSWNQPIQTNLSGGIKLFTTGLPGSGGILSFILNIFDDKIYRNACILFVKV
jgi:gamma-glutamyltranspeptidase/glutathione hydrolase/leukotriene-C4 hydrolase